MSGKTVDGLMELVATCRNFPSSARAYEAVRTYAEALAAPQEQPARYCNACEQMVTEPCSSVDCSTPEVAALPAVQPLTDEQIADIAEQMDATDPTDTFWREFARAIERAIASPAKEQPAPSVHQLCSLWFDEWELILPPDARESFRNDLLPSVAAPPGVPGTYKDVTEGGN